MAGSCRFYARTSHPLHGGSEQGAIERGNAACVRLGALQLAAHNEHGASAISLANAHLASTLQRGRTGGSGFFERNVDFMEALMYAVVRTYSGAGATRLFDVLEQRERDVESVIRDVPGLKSYTLLRSSEGGVSVTVCDDQAGAEQSLKVAREFIQKNAPDSGASPPTVLQGTVILQIK
jgi:hypothetical protein